MQNQHYSLSAASARFLSHIVNYNAISYLHTGRVQTLAIF